MIEKIKKIISIVMLSLIVISTYLSCAPPVETPEPIVIDEYTVIYFDKALFEVICAQVNDPTNIKLSDLEAIKDLNVANKIVKSLTNIGYLKNLESLGISKAQP